MFMASMVEVMFWCYADSFLMATKLSVWSLDQPVIVIDINVIGLDQSVLALVK